MQVQLLLYECPRRESTGGTSTHFWSPRFFLVESLNDNQKQLSRSCVAKGPFVECKDLLDAQPEISL